MARSEATGLALMFLGASIAAPPCLAAALEPAPVSQTQADKPELYGGLLVEGSRVLLLWGSGGTILRSEDGARWSRAVTSGSADLALAASNDRGDVLIAVGSQGTILRSTDAGRHWRAARNRIADTDLRGVVNQPGSRTWIAAGTRGRVLRSTDDGRNWSLVNSRLEVAFQTLFVDPKTQSILIGGDGGMVGSSIDAGVSWQITALAMPEPATPVTTFHRFGKLLLATSARGRFLTSENDAQSWDLMQASTPALFTDCAFDPLRGAIVMIGDNGDVLRSADNGRSWEGGEIALDGRKHLLTAILFDARSGSLLALGHGGTLARSVDGGATWSRASDDVRGDVRGLLEDSTRNRLIAFGTRGMVISSTDGGATWTSSPID